jgi:hypothetical protein
MVYGATVGKGKGVEVSIGVRLRDGVVICISPGEGVEASAGRSVMPGVPMIGEATADEMGPAGVRLPDDHGQ